MNCLSGCAADFPKPLQALQDGETQSPFVVLTFGGGDSDSAISVGNESSPSFDNSAVIKSFDFGFTDGMKATFEIIDEQGGAFQYWVDRITRRIDKASSYYKVSFQFGWIVARCDGTVYKVSSPLCYCTPVDMDVNFENGIVKYRITMHDLAQTVFVSRENQTIGTDDHPVGLKEALRSMMGDSEPRMNVRFVSRGSDGTTSGNESGGDDGWDFKDEVKSTWSPDNQNKLSAAMKMIEPFVTENDKGVHPMWSTTDGEPTLIFMEDPTPAQGQSSGDPDTDTLGTWIVNGGNCSNVISFNPSINWIAAAAMLSAGGNTGSSITGKTETKTKDNRSPPVQGDNVGTSQSVPVTKPAFDVHGTSAVEKTSDAQEKHALANRINTRGLHALKAELKFQGEPRWVSMVEMLQKKVAIVVINPFQLRPSDNACGDWLAQPLCNEVLTSKNWRLRGVSHSIREGSFVTTFDLFLDTPDMELGEGEPFGGDGYVNQWSPDNG